MGRDEALGILSASAHARTQWLTQTVPTLQADAVWLVGSLASGEFDEWSDLDLIVAGGVPALDNTLLTLDVPANGPADGGYVGAMYDGPLPLWVDWYSWPPDAPIPVESQLLAGTGTRGRQDLSKTLDLIGRGAAGPAPDPELFALAMLPLAAKQIARGNLTKAAAITSMLNPPFTVGIGAGLSAVLSRVKRHESACSAVGRYLDVAEAIAGPEIWKQPSPNRQEPGE